MEARKITIVSTKTQKKSVIMSEAETLRQLKNDLRNAGIDYTDMTFFEGTSKTELKTDESVLPKDVPYTNRTTGETKVTNELVFMLTNTSKKIKSGAMTRKEMYEYIQKNNLKDKVKECIGVNYTLCSNSSLSDFIYNCEKNKTIDEVLAECPCGIYNAFKALINTLKENKFLPYPEVKNIESYLDDYDKSLDSSYSDTEIDNMFNNMY